MKEQLEEVNQSLACYRPLPVLLGLENQTLNSVSSEAQKLASLNKWIINEAMICEFDASLASLARLNSSMLLESFIGKDIHELFECIVEESIDHIQPLTQLSNAISDTQFKAPILNKFNVFINDSNESCASVVKLSFLQDTLNKKVESSTTIERLMNSINSNFGDIQMCNECGQPLETHEVKH
jgi:hypothetical protein